MPVFSFLNLGQTMSFLESLSGCNVMALLSKNLDSSFLSTQSHHEFLALTDDSWHTSLSSLDRWSTKGKGKVNRCLSLAPAVCHQDWKVLSAAIKKSFDRLMWDSSVLTIDSYFLSYPWTSRSITKKQWSDLFFLDHELTSKNHELWTRHSNQRLPATTSGNRAKTLSCSQLIAPWCRQNPFIGALRIQEPDNKNSMLRAVIHGWHRVSVT